jgi:hypothetical protein
MKLLNFDEFLDHVNEKKEIEEFNLLTESFNSSIIQSLAGIPKGSMGKKFFDALSKMGIAASDITNNDITTLAPADAAKWTAANPNDILIYFSNKEKPNPYAGVNAWRDEKTVPADTTLAVVKGKVYMGLEYDRWASKNGKAEYKLIQSGGDDSIGVNKSKNAYGSGLNTLSKMAEVSDIVYVINPATVPSSKDLRKERAESRQGAAAFIDDKQFKKENQSRYEAILRDRASKTDIDQLVQDAIDELSLQIKTAIDSKLKSKYGDVLVGTDPKGREIKMSDAGNLMSNILRTYDSYANAMNSAEESEKRHNMVDTYYRNSAGQYAKTLKDYSNKVKAKNYAW